MLPHHGRMPPAIPARSPLRPRPSLSASLTVDNDEDTQQMTLASLIDKEKPLPEPEQEQNKEDTTPPLTKRQHALHELLSSERAYASDLALIREVHIPLALGHTIPLDNLSLSTPNSSGSSSARSSTADLGPPMTQEDVKIIFGNIAEIAVFSELFCQALEEALGDLLEGGKGDDHVGALFLSIIPELERPYKQYITRHPTALTHLQQLPQTHAIQNYLSHTQTIASSLSHAWDLSSLLIKPVQRLLKYPLLLTAIIDETPDKHSDKKNLREARKKMEEVARNVNEGRRRAEVVRDVLTSKKKPVGVTVSASVNLTKMKSIRVSGGSNKINGPKDDKTPEEATLVERLEKELKAVEEFAQEFAKNVVEWAHMTSNVVGSLRTWALSFAKVIGLTEDQGSEAFDAFLTVVEHQLKPLCVDLEAVINERVLKELAHLLTTTNQPHKLLASMNEQAPYHHHLMDMNFSSKNRPPPSLLSASTNYLALRGQLATELPTYITLLHRGLYIFIQRVAAIQTEFWSKVREHWLLLWEMLRLEEELNVSIEETSNVWFARWCEVDEFVASISIVQGVKLPKTVRSMSRDLERERERGYHHRERERERERGRGREMERELERDDPEADAEFYTHHHLQAFAHHQSSSNPSIPDSEYTYTQNHHYHGHRPPSSYTPSSPSSPPTSTNHSSTFSDQPNSPNSFATSFASSLSGGYFAGVGGVSLDRGGDRGRDRDRDRNRDKDKDPKKKSSAQAANAISLLGALEPVTYVGAGAFIAPPAPLSPRSGYKADVSGVTRARGSSDLSSFGSGSFMSSIGLGNGGGGGRKSLAKKESKESLSSKATTARNPQATRTSPIPSPKQPSNTPAYASGQGQAGSRSARHLPSHHPHPQRRRTMGGVEPAPEDLREYEMMMTREQEKMRERERERDFAGYAGKGNDKGNSNGIGNGNGHAQAPQYHQHVHKHGGLPRTKSMPLPYHPQPQLRPQSQGGQVQQYDQAKRGAGEWSEYADEEDSELFYQAPVQGNGEYEREEYEPRAPRRRERERKDDNAAGGGSGRPNQSHSRQRSVGKEREEEKEKERKRYSEHSTQSSKSREEERKKEKEKPSSSRKRSGSIKSITSFFTANNRDSHGDFGTTSQFSRTPSPRDSWAFKPAKYTCQVIHPCKPPTTGSAPLSYFSFPFFTLKEQELYDVLQEAGHPSLHPNLPLIVDEGEDCLLLCRAWDGSVGWALASFLEPVGSIED